MTDGLIIKGISGTYTVLVDGVSYACNVGGIFRYRKTPPLVGDKVQITITDKKTATLNKIKPRENELRRPPAANIEQVIITVATTQPDFNAGLLDRFLCLIEHENIPVLICINKADLQVNQHDPLTFEDYKRAGYDVVYTDAMDGAGLDELRIKMAGKVNLFAGPSGVGKSSIINALMPGINLETGELSTKIGRGKHTTRHTEIFPLGETPEAGYCFDTPGFTSLDIEHIQKNELASLFREFSPFINDCKFNDCLHVHEALCAVKEQIGKTIHPARYESYVKLATS
ncbi:MAG: ribosome small subunit-dependent GTPase A [Defluviitaleaceae bacterium]|nr:ribosome small subunit-dependent GTPase A [Defluviitaleaceae bacterium]